MQENVVEEMQGSRTEEHIQKMTEAAEKNDELNNPAPPEQNTETPQKPEWCPDKFWNAETGEINVEAMAKENAYLASKVGKGANKKDAAPEPETAEEETDTEKKGGEDKTESDDKEDGGEEAAQGLRLDDYAKELAESGKLSDETYEEITRLTGIDRQMIDLYVYGLKAKTQALEDAVHQVAGGSEQFEAMADWARRNLPKEDIEAYDKAIATLDVDKAVEAAKTLYAKYADAEGHEPVRLEGDGALPTAEVFNSRKEMMDAINNPAYGKDPDYTRRVREKIVRSNVI